MLTPLLLRCMMKAPQAGWVIAARLRAGSRKVRTPQGTAPGKPRDGAICRIGPQKEVAALVLFLSAAVKVKRWCKRPPAFTAMWAARQPPSGARSSRDNGAARSF